MKVMTISSSWNDSYSSTISIWFKYYTGRNKNVAALILNDLSLKIAKNKRSLHEMYIEFLLFSERKLHFITNYLNFNILIVLLSCFQPFSTSAYCSSSFVVMPRSVFSPIFLYTCFSMLFASWTESSESMGKVRWIDIFICPDCLIVCSLLTFNAVRNLFSL